MAEAIEKWKVFHMGKLMVCNPKMSDDLFPLFFWFWKFEQKKKAKLKSITDTTRPETQHDNNTKAVP